MEKPAKALEILKGYGFVDLCERCANQVSEWFDKDWRWECNTWTNDEFPGLALHWGDPSDKNLCHCCEARPTVVYLTVDEEE